MALIRQDLRRLRLMIDRQSGHAPWTRRYADVCSEKSLYTARLRSWSMDRLLVHIACSTRFCSLRLRKMWDVGEASDMTPALHT